MKNLFFALSMLVTATVLAQSTRISDRNRIGWYALNGTFNISDDLGIHTEYQWRRDDYIENWQQGLLRVGVNYKPDPAVTLRLGYAWAETFNYGDIPINGFGKTFTEHRIFQMAQIGQTVKSLALSHRFMLEQRFVGRFDSAESKSEDEYLFMNRARYMLRVQRPIVPSNPRFPYLALYNEMFIGFGNNVGENIFDQNRFGAIMGIPVNQSLKLEGGYLNQIVQLGREVEGRNVLQRNNGFIVTALLTIDCRPNPEKS